MYLKNQYLQHEQQLQNDVQTFYNELETFSKNPTEIFSGGDNPFLGYITNLSRNSDKLTFDLGVNKSFVVRHFNNVFYKLPPVTSPDQSLHSMIHVYLIKDNKEVKLDLEYILVRNTLYKKDTTGTCNVVQTQKEPFMFFEDFRLLSL